MDFSPIYDTVSLIVALPGYFPGYSHTGFWWVLLRDLGWLVGTAAGCGLVMWGLLWPHTD